MERTVLVHVVASAVAAAPSAVFVIPDLWLTLLIGAVLPAVTAVLTSKLAESWVKALVLLGLSLVSGVAVQARAGGGAVTQDMLLGVAFTFGAAVVAHYGALKPLRVTGSDGLIQNAFPRGLGHGRHVAGGGSGTPDVGGPGSPPVSLFEPRTPPR
jgi:hypothetical protein